MGKICITGTTRDIIMKSSQKNDVIISGVSCRLPKSKNMNEFKENLMKGVDMVSDDGTRWKPGICCFFSISVTFNCDEPLFYAEQNF